MVKIIDRFNSMYNDRECINKNAILIAMIKCLGARSSLATHRKVHDPLDNFATSLFVAIQDVQCNNQFVPLPPIV